MNNVQLATFILLPVSLAFFQIARSRVTWKRRTKGYPLPPSRGGWPLLGNLFDVVASLGTEWEAYEKWGKELGSDILFINAVGTPIVVLNSKEMADDLLDNKSSIFSCRPQINMINHMGWDWVLPLLPYGESWRIRRRIFVTHFHPSDNSLHKGRSVDFLNHFLVSLLQSTSDVQKQVRRLVCGIMFSTAYGIDLTRETHYHDICEEAIQPLVDASVPGRFMIDFIPWLKYVPEWVPGAGFQKKAAEWRALQAKFRKEPFEEGLRRMDQGGDNYIPSFVSLAMGDVQDREAFKDHAIATQDAAAMFYAAGSETTISVLEFFILAMILHPDVQRKAQREIDAALLGGSNSGDDKSHCGLPTFEDVENLPYISAIIKETLRWQPVAPIGVPHLSTEDYVYKGYFIPKGTIMISNAWAMLRSEEIYEDAQSFKPERFLNQDGSINEAVPDPQDVAFGFGRRVCPGKHIGSATVLITAASLLFLFDICKGVNELGEEITPTLDSTTGLARSPKPFKCRLKPRSDASMRILESLGSDRDGQ